MYVNDSKDKKKRLKKNSKFDRKRTTTTKTKNTPSYSQRQGQHYDIKKNMPNLKKLVKKLGCTKPLGHLQEY